MSARWIKVAVGFWAHPKVLAAGRDAAVLHLVAIDHCAQNLSDGFVTATSLQHLCTLGHVKPKCADKLVEVGLWETVPNGWQIHDYLDFQQSRASVERERDAARDRMRAVRSRDVRTNTERTGPDVRAKFANKTETETETETRSTYRDLDTQDRQTYRGEQSSSGLVHEALELAVTAELANRDINRPVANRDRWALGYRSNKLTECADLIDAWTTAHPNGTARALAIEVFGANPLHLPTEAAS